MLRAFGIICLIFCCLPGSAQVKSNKPLSVLLSALKKTSADSTRVYSLLQIANYYLERVPAAAHKTDSALFFVTAAGKITGNGAFPALDQEVKHCSAKYYLNTGNTVLGKIILLDMVNVEHDHGNKSEEIRWLIDLEDHIQYEDTTPISKLDCLHRLVQLYDPSKERKQRIAAEFRFGNYYYQQSNWDSVAYHMLRTIDTYKPSEPELLFHPFFILSEAYRYQGDLNKALMYALKSMKAADQLQDVGILDFIFGQLGLVYQDLDMVESSIEWFAKALHVRMKTGKEASVIYRTAGFLVQQLIRNDNRQQASEVMKKVTTEISPKSDYDSATLLQLKANYYNALKRYDVAGFYYDRMMNSKAIFTNLPEISVIAYQDIGSFYLFSQQYEKARYYLENALLVKFQSTTPARIRDIHLMLYTLDSSTKNYVSALNHMRQYQRISDSLFDVTKRRQIEELKIEYETEKIGQDNKLLEKEARLQQSRLIQANLTRNRVIGALLTMFIVLGFLIYNSNVKQKTNRKLELQQQEISQKNNSLNHLITEKEWLIKEIHHRVKNNFHTVIGLLDTQAGYLKSEEALAALKESQHRVQAMAFIHQKLYQSANLSSVEMSGYIYELVDYLRHSFAMRNHVVFNLEIQKLILDLSHALPLALILNEAITNSIKYGFPGNRTGAISISLKNIDSDQFLLVIADNGIGIPDEFDFESSDTMGMKLMKGLSEDIYGHLDLQNIGGTSISISFTYHDRSLHETAVHRPSFPKLNML